MTLSSKDDELLRILCYEQQQRGGPITFIVTHCQLIGPGGADRSPRSILSVESLWSVERSARASCWSSCDEVVRQICAHTHLDYRC